MLSNSVSEGYVHPPHLRYRAEADFTQIVSDGETLPTDSNQTRDSILLEIWMMLQASIFRID